MNKIKSLRESLGLTQEELGNIINVQKAAVSKYELGRAVPSTDVLSKLACHFGVTTDYLLGLSDEPNGFKKGFEVNSVGKSIRKARKALGLTQEEVATSLGLDRTTIAQWERGISFPRTGMLIPLAKVLHCGVETLINDRYPNGGEEVYKLKELRRKANITQAKLAEQIGVTQQAIGMYEQERREPSFDVLAKIADYFGVSTDVLIGRQGNLFEPMSDSGSAPQYPNNKFRKLRMERNLTQAELIEQYNQRYNRTYSIPALSLFENGRRMPELPALMDFARFFNCSLDYLVGMEPEETLGDRLSVARKNAGLTQQEVESYTGINYKTISNWENNVSNPSPAELATLCYLYDVSADDLLGVKRIIKED